MKIETIWQAENKALKYNTKNPINYHFLIGENSLDELIYDNFIDSFENNMAFDEKKIDFLEFLEGNNEKNAKNGKKKEI